MKKFITLSLFALILFFTAGQAQAFKYMVKVKNKPFIHIIFFSTNNYLVKKDNIKTNILPILKIWAKDGIYQGMFWLAFANYKAYVPNTALYYINNEIQEIYYILNNFNKLSKTDRFSWIKTNKKLIKTALKNAIRYKIKILKRQKAINLYFKGLKLADINKYKKALKDIKSAIILQPNIVNNYSVIGAMNAIKKDMSKK